MLINNPVPRPPVQHIQYLDGWRGLAIALVLEGHFLGALPIDAGRFGVDVFFVLSGFLMAGLLFVQRQPLPLFYKRRVSRIVPAFVLFTLVSYGIALAVGRATSVTEVLSTLAFLRTYYPLPPDIWHAGLPIGHLWSLNVEEHSYVFMSALVALGLLRGREEWVLLTAAVATMAVGIGYAKLGEAAPAWGTLGSEVAATHLLASAGYRLLRERRAWRAPPWAPLLALIVTPFCYSNALPWWSDNLLSPLLLAFAVNHLPDTWQAVRAGLSLAPLRQLGVWSFSIYLWQQPFYTFRELFPGGSAVALAAAIATALACFYFVEQPARQWINSRW